MYYLLNFFIANYFILKTQILISVFRPWSQIGPCSWFELWSSALNFKEAHIFCFIHGEDKESRPVCVADLWWFFGCWQWLWLFLMMLEVESICFPDFIIETSYLLHAARKRAVGEINNNLWISAWHTKSGCLLCWLFWQGLHCYVVDFFKRQWCHLDGRKKCEWGKNLKQGLMALFWWN